MNILKTLIDATKDNIPLKLAWKRSMHKEYGHPLDKCRLIKLSTSEHHPLSTKTHVYTMAVKECTDCDMVFLDGGVEERAKTQKQCPNCEEWSAKEDEKCPYCSWNYQKIKKEAPPPAALSPIMEYMNAVYDIWNTNKYYKK